MPLLRGTTREMPFKPSLSELPLKAVAAIAAVLAALAIAPRPAWSQMTLSCAESGPGGTHYGHFPYREAPPEDLVDVGNGLELRSPAARSFRAMQAAAARDGVRLVVLSAFRDYDYQSGLFYDIAAQRGQTPAQRARVSAPPGHSEHHTGYAVDIGDADARYADFQESFADTRAGRWLMANAAEFGFELSFLPDHPCVAYEPWHWRWVGDGLSQKIFAAARRATLPPIQPYRLPRQPYR